MCGEKPSCLSLSCPVWGSPPRVRGKEVAPAGQRGYLGITPACAGKSAIAGALIADTEDHPRVCGEKTKKSP